MKMKKFVALMTVIVLVFVGIVGCGMDKLPSAANNNAVENVGPAINSVQAAASAEVKHPDYEELYAIYAPDTVIMKIDGRDVTWGEYFGWYYTNAKSVENYMESMAMYGYPISWDDMLDENDSYASYTNVSTEATIKQMQTLLGCAEANGVELSEESLAAIEAQKQSDIVTICGEGAGIEDLYAYLETVYMPVETYEKISSVSSYQQELIKKLYGADNSLVSDEAALKYLNDNGYMSAHHILILTTADENGVELTEAQLAEKQAQALAICDELKAVEDEKQRLEKFGELKEQYCEDTGKVLYPNGYTFAAGQMVAEFENTVLSLNDYEISEPVKSAFGYHVIMRLPLDPDALISTPSGEYATGRSLCASSDFSSRLQNYLENMSVEYVNGFEGVDITEYLSE